MLFITKLIREDEHLVRDGADVQVNPVQAHLEGKTDVTSSPSGWKSGLDVSPSALFGRPRPLEIRIIGLCGTAAATAGV